QLAVFQPIVFMDYFKNFKTPLGMVEMGEGFVQNRKLARTAIEFVQKKVTLLQRCPLEQLPLRVTHNDTKINNVLFDRKTNKPCCIIDLDTLMPGYLIFDFGDMVRTFCSRAGEEEQDWTKVHLDIYLFEKLCEGFFVALAPLMSKVEKLHLIDGALLITYEQAIRFLNDYLTGDRYYRTTYPGHNLSRAHNQIQLLRSMLDQELQMKQIVQDLLG
ncbi:MAG: aminoglycoside phosphotransferase family protein, partial [Bacteroidota bacterium]